MQAPCLVGPSPRLPLSDLSELGDDLPVPAVEVGWRRRRAAPRCPGQDLPCLSVETR